MSVRKSTQTRKIQTKPVEKFVWEKILIGSTLPSTTKLVAFGLAVHATGGVIGGGKIRPGVPRLAAALSLGARSVTTHLEKLHELGFIDVVEFGSGNQHERKKTKFQLTVPQNLSEWLHDEFELKLPDGVAEELGEWERNAVTPTVTNDVTPPEPFGEPFPKGHQASSGAEWGDESTAEMAVPASRTESGSGTSCSPVVAPHAEVVASGASGSGTSCSESPERPAETSPINQGNNQGYQPLVEQPSDLAGARSGPLASERTRETTFNDFADFNPFAEPDVDDEFEKPKCDNHHCIGDKRSPRYRMLIEYDPVKDTLVAHPCPVCGQRKKLAA